MGKVTISTVLGYKEYVVENIKNIRGEDEENSDFRIYPDYHKIYRGQTEIVLTKAEYELFMLLSGRPGVIFKKKFLRFFITRNCRKALIILCTVWYPV